MFTLTINPANQVVVADVQGLDQALDLLVPWATANSRQREALSTWTNASNFAWDNNCNEVGDLTPFWGTPSQPFDDVAEVAVALHALVEALLAGRSIYGFPVAVDLNALDWRQIAEAAVEGVRDLFEAEVEEVELVAAPARRPRRARRATIGRSSPNASSPCAPGIQRGRQ